MAGLKAARERGWVGGKKKGPSEDQKTNVYAAHHLSENKDHRLLVIIK